MSNNTSLQFQYQNEYANPLPILRSHEKNNILATFSCCIASSDLALPEAERGKFGNSAATAQQTMVVMLN